MKKNFESAMEKILSVSHEELERREDKWKKDRQMAKKKRASVSPASHAANVKN